MQKYNKIDCKSHTTILTGIIKLTLKTGIVFLYDYSVQWTGNFKTV